MINANLVPLIKELIYSQYYNESTDNLKLNAILKFDRVVLEIMADAFEAKAVDNNYNPYFICNLFSWYSTYAKSYGLLFEMNKFVEVSAEEKASILRMVDELTDIDDADTIIEKLHSLIDGKDKMGATGNKVVDAANQVLENTVSEIKPDLSKTVLYGNQSKPTKKAKQAKREKTV